MKDLKIILRKKQADSGGSLLFLFLYDRKSSEDQFDRIDN